MLLQIQCIKTPGTGGENKVTDYPTVSAFFKIYLRQHAVDQKQYNHFYNYFIRQ